MSIKTITTAFLLFFLLTGCQKEMGMNVNTGPAEVKFELMGGEHDQEDITPNKDDVKEVMAKANQGISMDNTQRSLIPFAEDMQILAELEEVKHTGKKRNKGNGGISTMKRQSSGDKRAAIERYNLDIGIMYKILVYLDGALVEERSLKHGEEGTVEPMYLDGGETYTFVSYSVNSETDLPEAVNKSSLNTVSVENVDADFMWFRTEQMMNGNEDNLLSIILKHVYSEVTLIVNTGSYGGVVNFVEGPIFSSSRVSGSIKLADGAVTYATASEAKAFNFQDTEVNKPTISSDPLIMISPAITNGTLTIAELSINDLNKPLTVENLKLNPGKKYNLRLTVNAPCTERVFIQDFSLSNGESKQFTAPPSDYGFIFDVYYLDNSLNLQINGQALLQRRFIEERYEQVGIWPFQEYRWVEKINEIRNYDFQFVDLHTDVPPLVQNIRFKSDQKRWGIKYNGATEPDIPEIYFIEGDPDHPIFRIHILPSGEIKFYGSREDYGQLEEIEIWTEKRGPILNNDHKTTIRYYYQARLNPNIVWNVGQTNTIHASQVNSGPTNMDGVAYGRNRINCTVQP